MTNRPEPDTWLLQQSDWETLATALLCVDGEAIYCLTRYPLYLCLAKTLIQQCAQAANTDVRKVSHFHVRFC